MGFPTDSCWLFLVDKGKINSYSFVSELGLNYIIAIQHGDDGEIVPLTKDNLMQLAGKNEKLIKLIEKEKFYRAISLYNNSHDDSNEKKAPDVHLRHKK